VESFRLSIAQTNSGLSVHSRRTDQPSKVIGLHVIQRYFQLCLLGTDSSHAVWTLILATVHYRQFNWFQESIDLFAVNIR
jgi:hypothetical protein